jgi:hypothetical protein
MVVPTLDTLRKEREARPTETTAQRAKRRYRLRLPRLSTGVAWTTAIVSDAMARVAERALD